MNDLGYEINKNITLSEDEINDYQSAILDIETANNNGSLLPMVLPIVAAIITIFVSPYIINLLIGGAGTLLVYPLAFIVAAIGFAVEAKIAKKKPLEIVDTNKIYIEKILRPMIAKIDNKAIVKDYTTDFPIYGKLDTTHAVSDVINNMSGLNLKDKNGEDYTYMNATKQTVLNDIAPYLRDDDFGKWLYEKGIIPHFDSGFETELLVDTLTHNKNGMYFINGTATSKYKDTNGNTRYMTMFEGPIFAVRLNKKINSDITLYSSSTKYLTLAQKETNNGYIPIKETIDTENEEFNINFEVSATDSSQAFYVLTPLAMEKLLEIKKIYGEFGIYIHDDYMIVGWNKNLKELTKLTETTFSSSALIFKDICEAFDTAEMFKNLVDDVTNVNVK